VSQKTPPKRDNWVIGGRTDDADASFTGQPPSLTAFFVHQPTVRASRRRIVESSCDVMCDDSGNAMSERFQPFGPAVRRASTEARQARANQTAAELAPVITELRASGVTSLKAIAAEHPAGDQY
jgi:hypothetical protein